MHRRRPTIHTTRCVGVYMYIVSIYTSFTRYQALDVYNAIVDVNDRKRFLQDTIGN